MSDLHKSNELTGVSKDGHSDEGLDQLQEAEVQWRKLRFRNEVTIAAGTLGVLATLFLSFWALHSWGYFYVPFITLVAVAAIAGIIPSLDFIWRGISGAKNQRALMPIADYGKRENGREEKHPERQLLEAIERNGQITSARAALDTTLTVKEAERGLSLLAESGHIYVRIEDGRLVYYL